MKVLKYGVIGFFFTFFSLTLFQSIEAQPLNVVLTGFITTICTVLSACTGAIVNSINNLKDTTSHNSNE
jgi:hypothetical protein